MFVLLILRVPTSLLSVLTPLEIPDVNGKQADGQADKQTETGNSTPVSICSSQITLGTPLAIRWCVSFCFVFFFSFMFLFSLRLFYFRPFVLLSWTSRLGIIRAVSDLEPKCCNGIVAVANRLWNRAR